MKKYIMSRGTGKTTLLIHESERAQIPILCINRITSDYVREKAKKLGCSIPPPLYPEIFKLAQYRNADIPRVLVDEGDHVLSVLIRKLCGAEIEAFTMSVED